MSHLMTDLPALTPAEIGAVLKEKVSEQCSEARNEQRALRCAVRVDPGSVPSLVRWLAGQTTADKTTGRFYWRDRAKMLEIATLGLADIIEEISDDPITTVQTAAHRIADLPDAMRYYGGFRFTPQRQDNHGASASLPTARFFLPRFEFIRYRETLLFACNLLPSDLDDTNLDPILDGLTDLSFTPSEFDSPKPRLVRRIDYPDFETWESMLIEADQELQVGQLQKVVLARRSAITFDRPVSGWAMLEQLESVSDGCFLFGMEFDHGRLFFGSTPERLYHREGRRLQTEATAGTRARATGRDEDSAQIAELKASAKDSLEHRLVIDGILESLESLGVSHKQDPEISILTLPRLHHLTCRILGKLPDEVTDDTLLRALHPTPAVGGLPRFEAMQMIRRLEPFDREWYAGPIGWLGKDAAEFAVAIRSALATESELHLYAGAGIVPGSDAESEWQEIESKLARYISLLAE